MRNHIPAYALAWCAILSSTARAEAPAGRYALNITGTETVTINGKKIPSCKGVMSAPKEGSAIILTYKNSLVDVDGVKWKVYNKTTAETHAVLNTASKEDRYEISFWRDGQDGSANLIVYELDRQGKEVCATGLALHGTYTPLSAH
jgi:hypothetical protein